MKKLQLPEPYNLILHYLVCLSNFFFAIWTFGFWPLPQKSCSNFFLVLNILNLHCNYKTWIVPKSGTPQINIKGSRALNARGAQCAPHQSKVGLNYNYSAVVVNQFAVVISPLFSLWNCSNQNSKLVAYLWISIQNYILWRVYEFCKWLFWRLLLKPHLCETVIPDRLYRENSISRFLS